MADSSCEKNLLRILKEMDSVAVCFSGGVDSTLLSAAVQRALPEGKFVLFHVVSEMLPHREHEFAIDWASKNNLPLRLLKLDPLNNEDVVKNDQLRCYYCKKVIMQAVSDAAAAAGLKWVADGSNLDDLDDYRPGSQASKELGIRHPFIEAGFNKEMIRDLSRKWQLPNYEAPAAACLASRIPYGTSLDTGKLKMIDQAEEFLQDLGFSGCRVRLQGESDARIELAMSDLTKAAVFSSKITEKLKSFGFENVLLDLSGYRRGGGFNPKQH
ncbi:ATP-dependent sacrificial sulfur transferase LarE [Lentisphaerota bacterium ZTH]|nr:ATP-dependent sacrificial sulfur transferase LarE [Lentisphaerota bacterium]WET06270.1 ATP-dependent sacrificial sulfur transferase LarE [Lentisphaerota bacterium ZTH]